MIRSATHQALDYIVGVVLIIAPFLFVFWNIASATWVALLVGAALIIYSLFTQYTEAMDRPIAMSTHLTLDIILGVFLAISPWLFGFAGATLNVWMPHLIVGIVFILISLFSVRVPAGRTSLAGQLGGEAPPDRHEPRR